jgi:restriction system protein
MFIYGQMNGGTNLMPIPKYNEMYRPFLELMKDKHTHNLAEIKKYIKDWLQLSDDEVKMQLPSGRKSVFTNRVGWASTYLKKAGLIRNVCRGSFTITESGLEVIKENPPIINNSYLMKFPSFEQFKKPTSGNPIIDDFDTPDDTLEEAFAKINENLADDLLNEIMKISPRAFEQMIIDLLSKMGYGSFENAGMTTPKSGDEGIDGIIMEDKLGFDLIYTQAKQWNLKRTVGRPEVQSFVGAISGKDGKGLFVTTTTFSKEAIEYARHQHIILIDGGKLTKLMIEHNFGVRIEKTFEIKSVDTDIFNDYLDED